MTKIFDYVGYDQIVDIIEPGSSVLDLGCGEGGLLKRLEKEKSVTGTGIDIDENNVIECVCKGVSAIHENIDKGLSGYTDHSFDYVLLSQTLQVIREPEFVLTEMVRVGRKGIISFPNFGYWRHLASIFLRGRMPVNEMLPFQWYDSPNIHLATITDVEVLCKAKNIKIINQISLKKEGDVLHKRSRVFHNLFAQECIMVLSGKE